MGYFLVILKIVCLLELEILVFGNIDEYTSQFQPDFV